MIVTAALPWFDEAPEDLDRFVRALPDAADRLVAVDGGYARYPSAKARSPKAEEAAIRAACRDIGLPVDIVIPHDIWPGQVAKRTALYARAAHGSDWILTLDCDHILHGVRETTRHELEHLAPEIGGVEVGFYTTPNYERPLEETASSDWHSSMSGTTHPIRMFFRALPGIQVEKLHWWISGLRDGQRVWLYGNDGRYPAMPHHTLVAPLFVEHRCLYRRDRNILANRWFIDDRVGIVAATGQEDQL